METAFFAFLFGILLGIVFIGAIMFGKTGNSETVSAPVKTSSQIAVEMMQSNMLAMQNNAVMKQMQLENLRMETEMMELEQRKMDITSGRFVQERAKKEQALQMLITDLRNASQGRDVSPGFQENNHANWG